MEHIGAQGKLFDKDPKQNIPESVFKSIQTCINLLKSTGVNYSKDVIRKVLQNYAADIKVSNLNLFSAHTKTKKITSAYTDYVRKYRGDLVQVPLFRRYMDDFFDRHLDKKSASRDLEFSLFGRSAIKSRNEQDKKRVRNNLRVESLEDHQKWLRSLDDGKVREYLNSKNGEIR